MAFRLEAFDELAGPIRVFQRHHEDARGWFMEAYKASELQGADIGPFVQDNVSFSRDAGVLRGLHFQSPPHGQAKLVSCLRGAIFDVAADIRRSSPTYGHWVSMELRPDGSALWIPEGFAHGFCTLEPDSLVSYKVTREYAPAADAGIAWNDPTLAIEWPVDNPGLSAKDAAALPLDRSPLDRMPQ